jgi:hypothetical protein
MMQGLFIQSDTSGMLKKPGVHLVLCSGSCFLFLGQRNHQEMKGLMNGGFPAGLLSADLAQPPLRSKNLQEILNWEKIAAYSTAPKSNRISRKGDKPCSCGE